MKEKPKKYRPGDTVVKDEGTTVLVTDKHRFVKNGRPGFSGIRLTGPHKGTSVWGYDGGIVEIRPAAPGSHKAILSSLSEGRRSRFAVGQHEKKKAARKAKVRKNVALGGGAVATIALGGAALWFFGRRKSP